MSSKRNIVLGRARGRNSLALVSLSDDLDLQVVKNRSARIDYKTRVSLVQQDGVRMRNAGAIPDRIQRVKN